MSDARASLCEFVRFVEVQHPTTPGTTPPTHLMVDLKRGERVVSVETVKDPTGYASARVWIATNGLKDES